jgi:hypothetical protein
MYCGPYSAGVLLTRFRTYKIDTPPQTKVTSKDNIKGFVALKFLRLCFHPSIQTKIMINNSQQKNFFCLDIRTARRIHKRATRLKKQPEFVPTTILFYSFCSAIMFVTTKDGWSANKFRKLQIRKCGNLRICGPNILFAICRMRVADTIIF